MQKKNPTTAIPKFICGDCLEEMRRLPDACVDLVFSSPPYEDCRTYNIGFALKGQAWVDWMIEVYKESLRVCRGLVAFVVQGRTRSYRWSATPALLMADLHRAGIHLRDCLFYHRIGIPGSGSYDWLRHDVEYIVCATNGGRLAWSNNTAMGHIPKCPPGGPMSNRRADGRRVGHMDTHHTKNGGPKGTRFTVPEISNPGNLIECGNVGGGNIGSCIAHKNEAPFSEKLAEWMIRSFCPPDGVVLDPFAGSFTTCAVALRLGRRWSGIDIRESQIRLGKRRILEAKQKLRKERQHG